jgi:hypothetical protein
MEERMHFLDQMIPEIISDAAKLHLQPDQALAMIEQYKGIIPITIRASDEYKVVWLNVADYQFTEWKFRYSIKQLTTTGGAGERFTTDIDFLSRDHVLADSLYPAGFIFQMSLCGSTLLARALARSPHHIVINEATPLHEGLWQYLTEGWQQPVAPTTESLNLVKNIILAMGRRKSPEQEAYFVKFRSWNVIFIDLIMRAFPDVPSLFLYRDPTEVLVSALHKHPTGYLRFKGSPAAAFMTGYSSAATQEMSYLHYFRSLYVQYFLSVLKSPYQNIVYLNYNKLTKQNFANILQNSFHYTPPASQLALMQTQFDYYSKDDTNSTTFVSDKAKKQKKATSEIHHEVQQHLAPLYEQLECSERNWF